MKTVLLSFLLVPFFTNAQFSNSLISNGDIENFSVKIWKGNMFMPGFINNISANIVRSFQKMFGDPGKVNWFVDDKDITAYFTYHNEKVAVHYHGKGYYLSTRKVYDATDLEPWVYNYIRQEAGKKYIINLVTEAVTNKVITYQISLEDKNTWMVLQLERNNERNLLTTLDKKIYKKG
jgi:hypothetical protein